MGRENFHPRRRRPSVYELLIHYIDARQGVDQKNLASCHLQPLTIMLITHRGVLLAQLRALKLSGVMLEEMWPSLISAIHQSLDPEEPRKTDNDIMQDEIDFV